MLHDSQEQKPLLFPSSLVWTPPTLLEANHQRARQLQPRLLKITTKRKALPFGDYAVRGFESVSCVERKGSILELWSNSLAGDRLRFKRAFVKFLTSTANPILYLDLPPLSVWNLRLPEDLRSRENKDHQALAAKVLDRFLATCARHKVWVIWGGQRSTKTSTRRRIGEIILRALLHCIHQQASIHQYRKRQRQ